MTIPWVPLLETVLVEGLILFGGSGLAACLYRMIRAAMVVLQDPTLLYLSQSRWSQRTWARFAEEMERDEVFKTLRAPSVWFLSLCSTSCLWLSSVLKTCLFLRSQVLGRSTRSRGGWRKRRRGEGR